MISNNDAKRVYTVRRRFQFVATVGIIMLLLLYGLIVIYTLFRTSGKFVQQIVQISAIKNFEIKSKTIAQLK